MVLFFAMAMVTALLRLLAQSHRGVLEKKVFFSFVYLRKGFYSQARLFGFLDLQFYPSASLPVH